MNASAASGLFLPSLLRATWPRHTVKHVARCAGCGLDTARNWVRGRGAPSLDRLAQMTRNNDALRAQFIRAMTHADTLAHVDGSGARGAGEELQLPMVSRSRLAAGKAVTR
jgi:hypothetical protein